MHTFSGNPEEHFTTVYERPLYVLGRNKMLVKIGWWTGNDLYYGRVQVGRVNARVVG